MLVFLDATGCVGNLMGSIASCCVWSLVRRAFRQHLQGPHSHVSHCVSHSFRISRDRLQPHKYLGAVITLSLYLGRIVLSLSSKSPKDLYSYEGVHNADSNVAAWRQPRTGSSCEEETQKALCSISTESGGNFCFFFLTMSFGNTASWRS